MKKAGLMFLLLPFLMAACTSTSVPPTGTNAVTPQPTITKAPSPTATRVAAPSPTATLVAAPTSVALLLEKGVQTFGTDETFQIGLGDLDGDGDLDAVFANMANDAQVWLNDGAGQFVDTGQKLTRQGHGVGLGDLDGDGDLDVFITCAHLAGSGKPSRVYLNDGTGTLQESEQDIGDTDLSGNGVNLIDVDGDGDLDVHVVYYEKDKVYLNDGTGQFTDSGVEINEENIAWGDLDADGDVDVFGKAYGEGYRALLNDGRGHLAIGWQMQDSRAMYGDVALGDFDGDGDLDALIANGFREEGSYPVTLLWNDGTSQFSDSGQQLNETETMTLEGFGTGDLDQDGDLDVFVSNMYVPNQVWLNDGGGRLLDSGLQLEGSSPASLTTNPSLGDLDGDGDLDVFVGSFRGKAEVWFNTAQTPRPTDTVASPTATPRPSSALISFVDSGQRLGSARSWGLALGDLDGDSDLDAFVTNTGQDGGSNAVWLNDGQGILTISEQSLGQGMGIALGDIDDDGDLDAFVTSWDEASKVWLNDGSGIFVDSGQSLGCESGFDVELGDLDGDGDLEAVVANKEANTVWSNDGDGVFSDTGQRLGETYSASVGLGDLDGDGDLDALTGGWDEPAQVWLNDGKGAFAESRHTLCPADVHIHSLALGDVDGDGDLDAFMAVASNDPNQVWLNDGSGTFSDSEQQLHGSPAHGVALGDLDGDGDLDAFTAHGDPQQDSGGRVWLNDGQGLFSESGLRVGEIASYAVGLGDLDGDGDLDAFIAHSELWQESGGGLPNEVWLNETLQF